MRPSRAQYEEIREREQRVNEQRNVGRRFALENSPPAAAVSTLALCNTMSALSFLFASGLNYICVQTNQQPTKRLAHARRGAARRGRAVGGGRRTQRAANKKKERFMCFLQFLHNNRCLTEGPVRREEVRHALSHAKSCIGTKRASMLTSFFVLF